MNYICRNIIQCRFVKEFGFNTLLVQSTMRRKSTNVPFIIKLLCGAQRNSLRLCAVKVLAFSVNFTTLK